MSDKVSQIEAILRKSIPEFIFDGCHDNYIEFLRQYYSNELMTETLHNIDYEYLGKLVDIAVNDLIPNLPAKTALAKDKIAHFTTGKETLRDIKNIITGITGKPVSIKRASDFIFATSDNGWKVETKIYVKGVYNKEIIKINDIDYIIDKRNVLSDGEINLTAITISDKVTETNSITDSENNIVEQYRIANIASTANELTGNEYNVILNGNIVGKYEIVRDNKISSVELLSSTTGHTVGERISPLNIKSFDCLVKSIDVDGRVTSLNLVDKGYAINTELPMTTHYNGIELKFNGEVKETNLTLYSTISVDATLMLDNGEQLVLDSKIIDNSYFDNIRSFTSDTVYLQDGNVYGESGLFVSSCAPRGEWVDYFHNNSASAYNAVQYIYEYTDNKNVKLVDKASLVEKSTIYRYSGTVNVNTATHGIYHIINDANSITTQRVLSTVNNFTVNRNVTFGKIDGKNKTQLNNTKNNVVSNPVIERV